MGSDPAIRDVAMKSLAAFMRAVSKPLAAPLLISVAGDKLKMAKVEEYYEKFVAEFPSDGVMGGQHLTEATKPDTTTSRPISAKPAPKPSTAPPKKPFVNRGNTQPQLSAAKRVPSATTSAKPTTPNVARPANPPKRPVSVNRAMATPVRPASSTRPVVNKVPVRAVTPNVVKMPIADQNKMPLPGRVATPARNSAPIRPNVVTTARPGSISNNGATNGGDTKAYKLVRPDTATTPMNGENRRQTMLRPPS